MLADLLAPDLTLVFCGTAAGTASAARGAYYAGPGNKFWHILHETGLTPHRLEPDDSRDLLRYGLGLTDIVKRQAGNDADIDFRRSDPDALTRKLQDLRPRILAFNGKKAAMIYLRRSRIDYGLQTETVGRTKLFVAPSTSGAANGYWNAESWFELAGLAKRAE